MSLKFQIILPFSGTLSGTAIEHGNIDQVVFAILMMSNDDGDDDGDDDDEDDDGNQ